MFCSNNQLHTWNRTPAECSQLLYKQQLQRMNKWERREVTKWRYHVNKAPSKAIGQQGPFPPSNQDAMNTVLIGRRGELNGAVVKQLKQELRNQKDASLYFTWGFWWWSNLHWLFCTFSQSSCCLGSTWTSNWYNCIALYSCEGCCCCNLYPYVERNKYQTCEPTDVSYISAARPIDVKESNSLGTAIVMVSTSMHHTVSVHFQFKRTNENSIHELSSKKSVNITTPYAQGNMWIWRFYNPKWFLKLDFTLILISGVF